MQYTDVAAEASLHIYLLSSELASIAFSYFF